MTTNEQKHVLILLNMNGMLLTPEEVRNIRESEE